MKFWDYKKYYFHLSFLLLLINNSVAQPSEKAILFINLDTEKYDIDAYSYEESSVSNGTLSKLKVTIHNQDRNIAVIEPIDDLIKNDVQIVITDKKLKKEKMKIFMTGYLESFHYYVLDIEYSSNIFSLHIDNIKDLKVHKSYMGLDLTPKLKKQ